jgi:hypothetical protein
MQVLSAAYAFGICKHAELAGLHEQRAISLAAAGLPLAAFSDYLTSVKVRTAICLPACLPARPPAFLSVCLSVCLSACHTDVQTQLLKMGTQTLPVSASALQPLSDLIQMCCQEAAVYTCAFACSWI